MGRLGKKQAQGTAPGPVRGWTPVQLSGQSTDTITPVEWLTAPPRPPGTMVQIQKLHGQSLSTQPVTASETEQ